MVVDRTLLWDYPPDIAIEGNPTLEVLYVQRVLTRGRMRHIQAVGLEMIEHYLPHVRVPPIVREFWEWYFAEGRFYPDA